MSAKSTSRTGPAADTNTANGQSGRRAVEQLINAARSAYDQGDLSAAASSLEQVIARDPQQPDALYLAGVIAWRQNDNPLALQLITAALQQRDRFPRALTSLASVLMSMEEWAAARDSAQAALREQPRNPDALYNLGTSELELGEIESAVKHLRRAVALKPSLSAAWNNLGAHYTRCEDWAKAERHYRKAVEHDQDNEAALVNLAAMLVRLGQMDDAVRRCKQALALNPLNVNALRNLARAKKFAAADPDLMAFRQAIRGAATWTREQRTGFFFAWGKVLDDAGQFDDAFLCFDNGNRLRSEDRPYDPDLFTQLVENLQACFPRRRIDELRAAGDSDASPVFILGMPRSGTTLAEQILASHPRVHGAGELSVWRDVLRPRLGGALTRHYPAWLDALDPEEVAAVGADYLGRRPPAPRAWRVVDKMPGNFLHIGLIRLALPNARIIHCVRDPMDIGLSCLQKNFTEGQRFSYRQDWLGRRIRDYTRLMEFWREVFPGQWLDLPYEALVSEPEHWTRRLVDFVGLPWDDACLDHRGIERVVQTASAWQVRQPVYRSAVARWRAYEAHLGPLAQELSDCRDWHERFLRVD